MKVLHIIGGGDVGGAKVHVISLAKELSKHIEIKMISLRPGIFADDAKNVGIDIEVVKSFNIFRDIRKVIEIVKRENIEIIHSHGAKANIFSLIVKKFAKIPSVSTVHSDYRLDYMHSIFKQHTLGIFNTIALKNLDYYIGVSNKFKTMLTERKFSPGRIFTIYNGMDFESMENTYSRNDLKPKYNISFEPDDILVGIAARLYPVKDIASLLKAAKLVSEKNSKIKFLIGGDGEDRKKLENYCKENNLENTVHLLGWLNDPYEVMACVDISVLTSISETFPYSILEGAKFHKATISTDVGGIPDLITHGENGYLFKPGDYKTLAKLILDLAENKEKMKTMGDKLFEKATSSFSLKTMCASQLNIYNEIISRTPVNGKYDVIILGYYGFENLGDEALLQSIINSLREFKPNISIVALSHNPGLTENIHRIPCVGRFNILKIIKTMKKSKLFIYGGGTLIQETTSTRSLIYYLGLMALARRMELGTMMYANGVEPIHKQFNKILTKKILNKIDVITLRENTSMKELETLEVNKPDIVPTADPAALCKPCSNEEINNILLNEGLSPNKNYVAFCIRQWQGYEKSYLPVMARAAEYIYSKYGLEAVFIPMQLAHIDDIGLGKKAVSQINTPAHAITGKYTVNQVIGLISKMDMMIGMRLHALIFASSMEIPFLGLVYESKVDWFMNYIGLDKCSAGSVIDITLDRMIEKIDYVILNREEIKSKLKKETAILKSKGMQNAEIAINLLNTMEGK